MKEREGERGEGEGGRSKACHKSRDDFIYLSSLLLH